jgi:asparagine synthase (glutamine-hydrolysing)
MEFPSLKRCWRAVCGRQRAGDCPPIISAVRRNSLTYLDEKALLDLFELVARMERDGVDGSLVEAGCALGGSAIVMAAAKSQTRAMYVYDVFSMIPPPSEKDGPDVHARYTEIRAGKSKGIGDDKYYGYVDNLFDRVVSNFSKLGLPVEENTVRLVKGLFQDTLTISEPVAVAHIDGDWYESVMTCLRRIVPHLVPGGVVVVDDYHAWSGCRTAVDEYFSDKRDAFDFVDRSRLHIVKKQADHSGGFADR